MVSMLITAILAVPAPANAPPPLPDISGSCQFGKIEQNGERVVIKGEVWSAKGTIYRIDDGRVGMSLAWKCGGRDAIGCYLLDGDNFSGSWGWDNGPSDTAETLYIKK